MFEIEYKGGNGVVISTKATTVVIDPELSVVGQKPLTVKDKVVVATEPRFMVSGESRLAIDGPGEYEIGDVSLRGVAARRHIDTEADGKQATIYRVEAGDGRIAVIGNIAGDLDDQQLEDIGVVDVAIIPVGGGGYTLDAHAAVTLARKLDAKVVIPVHYADKALKYEVPQESVELFTKEFGQAVETVSGKYKVKAASALPAATTVVIVERS